MKVDEELIQKRIDRHFNWPNPVYRLDVLEDESRQAIAGRLRMAIVRPRAPEVWVSPLIEHSSRTGLLVGPDGKPL